MTRPDDSFERHLGRALHSRRLDLRPLRRAIARRVAVGLSAVLVSCVVVVSLFTRRSEEVPAPPEAVPLVDTTLPKTPTPKPTVPSRVPEAVLHDVLHTDGLDDSEPAMR